jgi:hypothetical protein
VDASGIATKKTQHLFLVLNFPLVQNTAFSVQKTDKETESTMGRSPLVRRPIRAQIRAQDVPRSPFDLDSPEKVTFPRRFPRLGREFQAKIARPANANTASNEQVSRPPPDLMSASYPHVSKDEEQLSYTETNGECCWLDFESFGCTNRPILG